MVFPRRLQHAPFSTAFLCCHHSHDRGTELRVDVKVGHGRLESGRRCKGINKFTLMGKSLRSRDFENNVQLGSLTRQTTFQVLEQSSDVLQTLNHFAFVVCVFLRRKRVDHLKVTRSVAPGPSMKIKNCREVCCTQGENETRTLLTLQPHTNSLQ